VTTATGDGAPPLFGQLLQQLAIGVSATAGIEPR
jgi:hypothetical protein